MQIEELYEIFRSSTGISTDTREVDEGQIFFALKGPSFDANKFAAKAIGLGAAYAIVDSDLGMTHERCIKVADTLKALQGLASYHRKQLSIPIIGITGSNGKTTVKELLAAVLGKKVRVFATHGNLNNHIGVPLSVLKINDKTEIAVIELGDNHPGEIAELCQITCPTHGFVTNVGKDHLEGFGSMDANYQAKAELYDSLSATGGTVFLDGEDPSLDRLASKVSKQVIIDQESSLKEAQTNGLMLDYVDELGQSHSTSLYGHYNLPNLRAAYAIGRFFGVEISKVNEALTNYTPSNNRSQLVKTSSNTILLDAYNANPSSVQLAIESLSNTDPSLPKIVILGDMLELGDTSSQEHRTIIELVARIGIKSYFCGSSFFENRPAHLPSEMQVFATKDELGLALKKQQPTGALVLLKGSRGMRMETLVDLL